MRATGREVTVTLWPAEGALQPPAPESGLNRRLLQCRLNVFHIEDHCDAANIGPPQVAVM